MSIWQKIKNIFIDTKSIKEEFQAMLAAEEKTAAVVATVTDQITDAVTQVAPIKKKPVKKAAPKAKAGKTTSKKKK